MNRISPPSTTSRLANRRQANNLAIPTTSRRTVLPLWIGLPRHSADRKGKGRARDIGFSLTRRRCEDGLLLGGTGWGIWKLGNEWQEVAIAGGTSKYRIGLMVELSSLVAVSILYMATRHRVPTGPVRTPTTISFARPGSPGLLSSYGNHVRERATRMSHSQGTQTTPISAIREDLRRISPTGHDEVPEPKGAVWGTEARDYRDCPDDGALFALLLAPLVAAGMLHASLDHLSAAPDTPLPKEWNIESPLVLHSTPIRFLQGITLFPTDAIRALSALATSRRNLVQLFTLCSFVLLVHLARSLHLENKQAKAAVRSTSPVPGNGVSMERDLSGPNANTGTYWLKRGEWKRTKSVVGFSFLVTICCLGVKVVTALIGRGVWSGMSQILKWKLHS
jgi:dolichol kinase